jgi:hypothetical protein
MGRSNHVRSQKGPLRLSGEASGVRTIPPCRIADILMGRSGQRPPESPCDRRRRRAAQAGAVVETKRRPKGQFPAGAAGSATSTPAQGGRFTHLLLKGVSADLPVLCTGKFPDRGSGPSRSPRERHIRVRRPAQSAFRSASGRTGHKEKAGRRLLRSAAIITAKRKR